MSQKNDDLDILLQSLPKEIEPPRDLWPDISARRPTASMQSESQAAHPVSQRRENLWRRWSKSLHLPVLDSWQGWAWQGAFAALCLLIGVSLGPSLAGPGGQPETTRTASYESSVESPAVTLAVPASSVSPSASSIENDLLRLKDDLWAVAYARRSELSDETLYVVETNLRIIDSALRDLHIALEADPGNRYLQGRIVDQHRKEIELLRRLASGAGNA